MDKKARMPKDKRTKEQKREDSLRNSAAIQGIPYEEHKKNVDKFNTLQGWSDIIVKK